VFLTVKMKGNPQVGLSTQKILQLPLILHFYFFYYTDNFGLACGKIFKGSSEWMYLTKAVVESIPPVISIIILGKKKTETANDLGLTIMHIL